MRKGCHSRGIALIPNAFACSRRSLSRVRIERGPLGPSPRKDGRPALSRPPPRCPRRLETGLTNRRSSAGQPCISMADKNATPPKRDLQAAAKREPRPSKLTTLQTLRVYCRSNLTPAQIGIRRRNSRSGVRHSQYNAHATPVMVVTFPQYPLLCGPICRSARPMPSFLYSFFSMNGATAPKQTEIITIQTLGTILNRRTTKMKGLRATAAYQQRQ